MRSKNVRTVSDIFWARQSRVLMSASFCTAAHTGTCCRMCWRTWCIAPPLLPHRLLLSCIGAGSGNDEHWSTAGVADGLANEDPVSAA
jgi:hypothetical protein